MKRKIAAIMAILCLVAALAGCSPFSRKLNREIYDEEEMIALAKQVVVYMAEEDYESLMAMTNEELKEYLDWDALKTANEKMRQKGGYFVDFAKTAITGDRGNDEDLCKVTVWAQHNKRQFTYTIVFDPAMQVVAFYLK